jgi:hypothetical protein
MCTLLMMTLKKLAKRKFDHCKLCKIRHAWICTPVRVVFLGLFIAANSAMFKSMDCCDTYAHNLEFDMLSSSVHTCDHGRMFNNRAVTSWCPPELTPQVWSVTQVCRGGQSSRSRRRSN